MDAIKTLVISLIVAFFSVLGISLILHITLWQTILLWLCLAFSTWSFEFILKFAGAVIEQWGKKDQ